MGLTFPDGSVSLMTSEGETLLLHICDLCGAGVPDAVDTDLAFHKRWHRLTGSGNWVDPATGRMHRVDASAG